MVFAQKFIETLSSWNAFQIKSNGSHANAIAHHGLRVKAETELGSGDQVTLSST